MTKRIEISRTVLALASLSALLTTTACAASCEDDGLLQDACAHADAGADPDAGAGTGSTDGHDAGAGEDRGSGDGDGDGDGSNDDADSQGSEATGSAGSADDGASDGGASADDGASSGTNGPTDDDQDDDGVSDAEDDCPAFANPEQDDADGDGLGDVCDLDVACGLGLGFVPLLAPEATADEAVEGLCVACSVEDVELVIDHDFTTHASALTTVGALGHTEIRVRDESTTHPAGARVGFVVDADTSVLSAELLAGLVLTARMGDEPNESTGTGGLADLEVLGQDEPGRALIVMTTTTDFDGVQLDVRALVGALAEVHVYAACVEQI